MNKIKKSELNDLLESGDIEISCGCFRGSIEEFEKSERNTRGNGLGETI